ncbi:hypothetical protein BDV18DRAFT_161443 [Aspergillus unguis]
MSSFQQFIDGQENRPPSSITFASFYPTDPSISSIQEFTNEVRERRSEAKHEAAEIQAEQNTLIWKSGSITLRRKELVMSISRLMTSPSCASFFDLTVACQDVRFRCHKAIVCAQSTTIRDTVLSASDKAQHCSIKIKCHPLVFRMALEYFYRCDYDFYLAYDFPSRFMADGQTVPADSIDRLDCCELSVHLQVHLLAHCLRIKPLKYLSAYKIIRVLQRASFPSVYPRFVREVYQTIKKNGALMKRLLVYHAEKVAQGTRDRNHFDGRFPFYMFQEIEGFGADFIAWKMNWDEPMDGFCTDQRIPSQLWYV